MGDVISFRQARKAVQRRRKEVDATASRALHGRTKSQVQAERLEAERLARLIDGAKFED